MNILMRWRTVRDQLIHGWGLYSCYPFGARALATLWPASRFYFTTRVTAGGSC